jgi:mannose-6-phosphate isomerase-like protein (cupin superfamily)
MPRLLAKARRDLQSSEGESRRMLRERPHRLIRRWQDFRQEDEVAIFNKDMVELAGKNSFWQKEVYRDPKVQIVLMSIPTGEEIGLETHSADQTTFIVEGEAQVIVDGHATKAGPNHLVVVPKGSEHNIINKGSGALKLFSVYAPPAEPEGAAFKTKDEAEEAEKGLLAKAADAVKGALG